MRKLATRHRATLVAIAVFTGLALSGQLSNLYSLIGSTTTSFLSGDAVALYFSPEADTHAVGEISAIDVRVSAPKPINTVGATIGFDPDTVEIVGVSKVTSFFDLWAEETSIKEQVGEIRFSGGTVQRGGFIGSGTMITLLIRPKKEGTTELSIKDAQIFAHDGKGSVLESDKRSLLLVVEPAQGANSSPQEMAPLNPDFNSDGSINLADISILAIQLIAPYNARYDLDRDGNVDLKDVSILFARMKTE